jgi:hypothetical protein
MSDPSAAPLVIADADTPSAQMAAGELRSAFGDVELRPSQRLFGAELAGRPLLVVRLCHPEFAWLPAYLARAASGTPTCSTTTSGRSTTRSTRDSRGITRIRPCARRWRAS